MLTRPPEPSGAAFRRKLMVYRVVLAAIVAVQVMLYWQSRATVRTIEVFDLPAEMARMAARPDITDLARTFYASETATVHLHLMGRTQRCPLHIHPNDGEVTAIVDGTARVSHVYEGVDGLTKITNVFTTGDIIQSPPWCGHEWVNPSADAVLGNLVFASPAFAGNLYVTEDDRRLRHGAAPTLLRIEDDLREYRRGGAPFAVKPLAAIGRPIRLVVTTRPFVIEGATGTVVFIRSGIGLLNAGGRPFPLGRAHLAILRNHRGATIVPTNSEPVSMLVFDAG